MKIGDSVVKLYVQKFIMPRALIFDKPGFVDFNISGKTRIYVRQLLVPESLFVNIQKEVVEKFGERGEQLLYSVGKKFGYRFAQVGRFENIKSHPGNRIKKWVTVACKFVEGTYASELSNETDVAKETIDVVVRNFAICRKLGYDLFILTGGGAGVMAWILQNKKLEGVLYDGKYESSGDHFCRVKYAPPPVLEEFKKEREDIKILKETNLTSLTPNFRDYIRFNAQTELEYDQSFQDFLTAGLFEYKRGVITYGDERFFLLTVGAMYLLEQAFKQQNMQKILFNNAFNTGTDIFSNKLTKIHDILGILCALGWGEPINLSTKQEYKVVINHFPWTKWCKDIDYSLIAGFISGIFSKAYGKKIIFKLKKADLSKPTLSLVFKGG